MPPPSPHLLVCGFGPFPNVRDNPAAATVERLRREAWAPSGATVDYALVPTTWDGAVDAVLARLDASGADGLLVVGVASDARCFRVETRARNAAATASPDAAGALHPHPHIEAEGPAHRIATAPVAAMVRAIAGEGLSVEASLDAGDYLCNYSLYRLLAASDAPGSPRVGFLHLPPLCEAFALDTLVRATRAAVGAFAEALASEDTPAQDHAKRYGEPDVRRG